MMRTMYLRIARAGVMLLALLAAPAWSQANTKAAAKRMPFLGGYLTETRVLYPLKVQNWEAKDEHRYDQAEYGASVRYVNPAQPKHYLTVYFYPAGLMNHDQQRAAFASSRRDVEEGGKTHYQNLQMGSTRDFAITLGAGEQTRTVLGNSTDLHFDMGERKMSSALVEVVTDLYFVKGRLSVDRDQMSPDQVRTQLEALITDIVQRSQFRSTGACWSPLPIRANAQLNAKAPGALATYRVDDTLAAVSFADRVEALDPDSDSARLAQRMSMAMADVYVQGCEAPDSMTPVVPEDLRELRFEYPPPNEDSDGTTPRLRASRRGIG